jgi:hypothetical protein
MSVFFKFFFMFLPLECELVMVLGFFLERVIMYQIMIFICMIFLNLKILHQRSSIQTRKSIETAILILMDVWINS